MSGKAKKRVCAIFLALILTVIVIVVAGRREWMLENRGDGFSTLAFVDREETVEETIIPYYSDEDDTYYLFLPSGANMRNVSIYFEGAKEAVFETEETSLTLKRGAAIHDLEPDNRYTITFKGGGWRM